MTRLAHWNLYTLAENYPEYIKKKNHTGDLNPHLSDSRTNRVKLGEPSLLSVWIEKDFCQVRSSCHCWAKKGQDLRGKREEGWAVESSGSPCVMGGGQDLVAHQASLTLPFIACTDVTSPP